ncbi:MAG: PspA/IM30 family protein [cyanobacterium endosymbiont of Rhopalodia musculus]|uniref:PspA/IM30 family protein n=1 Tax=cyanobacterium endosymbiont of Epithemia clementina EcSB TaxID=3034674 RepID=UPI002480F044|nr:PspA/IM30 family protein [cyanobacterium endosymbiont of Epithemia clementina EcSB]WGT66692.1 PspA/IM30 family protein [cyanobacterium endosymbiont of Epithemia clementina EcSB]
MEWLERISRVVRSQINSLIKEEEDPEKVLETAITQIEQELIAMRRALAEAIAINKSAQRQLAHHQKAAEKWYERATMAIDKGNDPLAREALINRRSYQIQVQGIENQLEQQNQVVEKVKQDLRTLERKYAEAKAKKSLNVARLRSAIASQRLQEIVGNLHSGSSTSIFEQMESRILELEAESQITQSLSTDPLEKQFMALEMDKIIDTEIVNLKAEKLTSRQSNQSSVSSSEIDEINAKLDQF